MTGRSPEPASVDDLAPPNDTDARSSSLATFGLDPDTAQRCRTPPVQ